MAINFLIDGQLPDDAKLSFGDSQDLEIYHDGSNSFIEDAGSLYIRGSAIRLQSTTGENMIYAAQDSAVYIYNNNVKKFETTSTGVAITGGVYAGYGSTQQTSTFFGNGAAALKWGNASSIGALTYDGSGEPVIRGESGKTLVFDTNGANNALIIDTSQNALFQANLNVGYTSNNGANAQVAIKKAENISADATSRGVFVDYNVSGTTAQTGDRYYDAIMVDLDSSATGGDTSNETRLSGARIAVTDTGDSNDVYGINIDTRQNKSVANDQVAQVYGIYATAKAAHTAGEVKNVYGGSFNANVDNADSGTNVSSIRGVQGTASNTGDSGKTVQNAYGAYGKVTLADTSNNGTFTNADGVYGEVEINDADVTISSARAVKGLIDSNSGTMTSAYQFYGSTSTSGTITNSWGIYSTGASKNYLAGTLQLASYGSGTLVTDASGNITVSSGGGAGGPYLPLAGGTLTGDLTISKNVPRILFDNTAGGGLDPILTANGSNFTISTSSITPLTIGLSTGSATFGGEIIVPSGDFISWGTSGHSAIEGSTVSNNLKLRTDNTVALTLDSSQNATFAGDIAVGPKSNATVQVSESGNSTVKMLAGSVGRVGTYSNHNLNLMANSNTVLTLDTSQNATIAGNLEVQGADVTITANIIHTSDSNTYFGFHNNDEWRVVTGGTERLEVSNSGIKLSSSGSTVNTILDEDNMVSDSATALATQQSIKAYVDNATTGVLTYQGTWNANTNSPTLSSGSGTPGYYYIVSHAGSTDLDGITDWAVGDWAVFSDQATDAWQKIDNTAVGNVSGSGVDNRLAIWSGTSTIDSTNDFRVDANNIFTPNLSATSGVTAGVSMSIGSSSSATLNMLRNSSNYIQATNATGKLVFRTGGTTTALTLDDSQDALFASDVAVTAKLAVGATSVHASYDLYNQGTFYSNGAATINADLTVDAGSISISGDGSNATTLTESGSGDFTIDAAGDITLDADGADIWLKDGGTEFGLLANTSNNLVIMSRVQDADIIFKGNDNGSTISALTLDMSEAGKAIFEGDVQIFNETPALTLTDTDNNSNIDLSSVGGALVVNSTSDQVFQIIGTEQFRLNASAGATFAGDVTVGDELTITTISNATADPDKFLCASGSNKVGYRTGAQVLSDIGAASSGSLSSYLPLAGGTMTGNIAMGNNDITGVNKIAFDDGVELFGAGNNNYLKFKSLSTSNGGILFQDGDSTTQGYLYYDGNATSSFGLLDGSGSWAVKCKEDAEVELRYDNSTKFKTSSTGVTVTGTVTATVGFSGELKGTIDTTTTGVTQSAGDNSTKIATTEFVTTAISNAPQGTVTGTGTTNFLPKFTATSGQIIDSEISDTGSVIKLGLDASSQETLYIDTTNRKVGFRTSSPGSAFDVNGTIRVRNQLNVGNTSEKNLYVNGNGSAGGQYVQMGNYGVPGGASPDNGNYFGITGTENQPKYCAAFGNAGKIVQDMRIITIKLSGDAFKLLSSTGTTLIPAPGANSFIIPYECIIHNTGGTSGNWNSSASTTAAIGFCDNNTCNYPGQFNRLFVINNTLLNTNASWYYAAGIATTGKQMYLNKALKLKASQNITTAPTGTWYIQLRYQIMNKDSGLVQNVDITKTTN